MVQASGMIARLVRYGTRSRKSAREKWIELRRLPVAKSAKGSLSDVPRRSASLATQGRVLSATSYLVTGY